MERELTDRREFLKTGLAAAVAAPAVHRLRTRVRGVVAAPGDPQYDEGRAAWNLAVDQKPALTVMAEVEDDIVAAVDYARERQLGVAVQATGHGVTVPANGGVLIQTGAMRQVRVDPTQRRVTVQPGAMWCDVLPLTQAAGLAPLSASSSGMGVVGYTLGGGSGWLGRKYGFAADHVTGARLVTPDGRVLRVDANENPDPFWGLRGGTSNFGIVTELEFRVFPDSMVYGGGIYWPIVRAREVATVYREFGAFELPPAQRPVFLDEACQGREELRAAVESLLSSHDEASEFLETPAASLGPASSIAASGETPAEDWTGTGTGSSCSARKPPGGPRLPP